jgi:hypothetical protein
MDKQTPQVAQIIFAEFLKFMFLVKMNVDELVAMEKQPWKLYKKGGEDTKKAYNGLVAPPILDLVWISLVKKDIYAQFCDHIFGGFVDRQGVETSLNDDAQRYSRTIKLLNKYENRLDPFHNLWPNYSDDNLLYESTHTAFVPAHELDNIRKDIEKEFNENESGGDIREWKEAGDKIAATFAKKYEDKVVEPKKFSDEEIKLDKKRTLKPKEILKLIEETNTKQDTLCKRLVEKYLITEDTAEAWISEYHKFLVLLVMDDTMFPSTKVEWAWTAHEEFTEEYRNLSFTLFGELVH